MHHTCPRASRDASRTPWRCQSAAVYTCWTPSHDCSLHDWFINRWQGLAARCHRPLLYIYWKIWRYTIAPERFVHYCRLRNILDTMIGKNSSKWVSLDRDLCNLRKVYEAILYISTDCETMFRNAPIFWSMRILITLLSRKWLLLSGS